MIEVSSSTKCYIITIIMYLVGKGLYIASVDYDPALSDGRLKSGDEIVQVIIL